jgi:hypothetical protein
MRSNISEKFTACQVKNVDGASAKKHGMAAGQFPYSQKSALYTDREEGPQPDD